MISALKVRRKVNNPPSAAVLYVGSNAKAIVEWCPGIFYIQGEHLLIRYALRDPVVTPYHWIIKDAAGNVFTCAPEVFVNKYEELPDA